MEDNVKDIRKRAPKTYTVKLKKVAFINGEKIGNQDGEVAVDGDQLKQLKASGVIDENSK